MAKNLYSNIILEYILVKFVKMFNYRRECEGDSRLSNIIIKIKYILMVFYCYIDYLYNGSTMSNQHPILLLNKVYNNINNNVQTLF